MYGHVTKIPYLNMSQEYARPLAYKEVSYYVEYTSGTIVLKKLEGDWPCQEKKKASGVSGYRLFDEDAALAKYGQTLNKSKRQ